MLRHRAARASAVDVRLLVSARSEDELLYRRELDELAQAPGLQVFRTLTRTAPAGWPGWRGRLDSAMLGRLGADPGSLCFVCGPTPFVEAATQLLVAAGHDPGRIHAERFGPTGGP